jgi:predicted transcriptional regulator
MTLITQNQRRKSIMIGIEQYRKIQEYKALGLAQTKTAKALGITYSSVSKYWNMSEEDYVREAEKERYCDRQHKSDPLAV